MDQPLLTVEDLRLALPGPGCEIYPVDGVDFSLSPGECVGLVGESGCGKSLTAQTITGLTRYIPGSRASGRVLLRLQAGELDLLRLNEGELERVRGGEIATVFQDPLSALNPLLKIDYQIREVLKLHQGLSGRRAQARVFELLELVGIPHPAQRASQYPHQLSGGLRQRALLALALAGRPQLLIADEPTTALDVTVQAQIIREIKQLQQQTGLAVLFITHDLGVVAQLCSRLLVMYAGRIVEYSPVREFFSSPLHPYSRGLLSSMPAMAAGQERLTCIPGNPPRPASFPPGCRFNPRCPYADQDCRSAYPGLHNSGPRQAACIHLDRTVAAVQAVE